MAKEKHRCEARSGEWSIVRRERNQCVSNASVFEDGHWYCKRCAPSLVKQRAEKRDEKWQARWAEEKASAARRARREELRDACVAIVRDVAKGYFADEEDAIAIIHELDAIDGKGGTHD